ncbi:MAG: protein kinase domain-containing protein [Planctomycetota bacterium]
MSLPDIRLALRALEDESIDRADLLRVITVLESWQRGELRGSCAELLVREFRVDPAKVRRWETEIAGQPVQRIGKYLLKRRIGQGGMGMVFEAEHPNFERSVALKILLPGRRSPAAMQRFLREVKSSGEFNHPHIVHAYDAGIDGDIPFLVLEYVDGENLFQQLLRNGPATVADTIRNLAQATSALWCLEARGWTHGDVKPSNFVITRGGHLKLIDLGLCRPPGKPRDIELIHGSPPYIAPEQLGTGESLDIRADLFALGATFYHLLTGRPPFAARTVADLRRSHQEQSVPPIRSLRPELPAALAEIIDSLVTLDRERRPKNCEELVRAIERLPGAPQVLPPTAARSQFGAATESVARVQRGRWSSWMVVSVGLAVFLLALSVRLLFWDAEASDDSGAIVANTTSDGTEAPTPASPTEVRNITAESAAWDALWQQHPNRPYPEIFNWLATQADELRVRAWRDLARQALRDEAEPIYTRVETELGALREARRFAEALTLVETIPERLRVAEWDLKYSEWRIAIISQRGVRVDALAAAVGSALGRDDLYAARHCYLALLEEPPADHAWYRNELDARVPNRPWLEQLEPAAFAARAALAQRRTEVRNSLARAELPAADWSRHDGDPFTEMGLEILALHPALLQRGGPVSERLLALGLFTSCDASTLVLVADLLAASDERCDLARESRAARVLEIARNACAAWDVSAAERAWQELSSAELSASAAARVAAARVDSDRQQLQEGALVRGGIFVAQVSGEWREPPSFEYVAMAPRFFEEWRARADRWRVTSNALALRSGAVEEPLAALLPFDGDLRLEFDWTPPVGNWMWGFEYGPCAVGILKRQAGELRVAIGNPTDVKAELAEERGVVLAISEATARESVRIVIIVTADSIALEFGPARHRSLYRSADLAGWPTLYLPGDATLTRISLTGHVDGEWLQERARLIEQRSQ